MNIKNIMTPNPITVSKNTTIKTTAMLMRKHNIGAIPVTENYSSRLLGIVTDRDIVTRCVSRNLNAETTFVENIMTSGTITVLPENSVTESSRIMAKNKIRRLPVVTNGEVIGIVSIGDISRSKLMFAETASAFCDICSDDRE